LRRRSLRGRARSRVEVGGAEGAVRDEFAPRLDNVAYQLDEIVVDLGPSIFAVVVAAVTSRLTSDFFGPQRRRRKEVVAARLRQQD
jgi:hypothetical protein